MKKLNLVLGACGHLPSGTGEAEFEAFYCNNIKPLVQALDRFPRINMVFHYSGVILYWIERRHPELFMLLEDLLSRKQAEFLGGGFYNPMLPLLPLADKIGQIEMLTTYLRKHFGKRPQGCWLPAMAWEQNLVGPLTSSGMNYTFLDDLQFSGAGAKPDSGGLFYPRITEDQGKIITVFSVAGSLGRELRTGKEAAKILEALLEKVPEGEYPVVAFPFGMESEPPWSEPDYENFFEKLSSSDSRIEFSSPARILKNLSSLNKIYFPGETFPRQFLAEHGEAGGIYAKTVHVHTLINNQLRGDKTRKRTALEELWKAQDSGVFCLGTASTRGLFHSPVRKAAYRSLLEAEKITREKGIFKASLSVFDFDLDGEGEYIFQDDKLNFFVKSKGAGIFELDYLPSSWNYLDTLSAARAGERRSAFVDWLAPAGTLPADAGPDGISGGRFLGGEEYEVSEIDRIRRRLTFTLPAKKGFPWGETEIEKTWQIRKSTVILEYVFKNAGTEAISFAFSPQADLSFPGEGETFLRVLAIRDSGKENLASGDITVSDTRGLEFQDIQNETIITLEASRAFDARIFQIHGGLKNREEYQSTCIMPFFQISLESGKTWKTAFTLRISS